MTMNFDEQVAIVTGAGRGLGHAHAMLLARGAKVVVNDLGTGVDGVGHDADPAHQVVDEIVGTGGAAVASFDNIATPDGAAAVVASAIACFGRVDILVNNAGILTTSDFPETSPDDFDQHLAVHLRGAFNMSRAAWPSMLEPATAGS